MSETARDRYCNYAIDVANAMRMLLEDRPTLLDQWPWIRDDVHRFADARKVYLTGGAR